MAAKIHDVGDAVWFYVGRKEKTGSSERFAFALSPSSATIKLILNIALGKREQPTTDACMQEPRSAIKNNRFQIKMDVFASYKTAIANACENPVDFAPLIKVYRATPERERAYSAAEVVDPEVAPVVGTSDPLRICTSTVHRNSLSLPHGQRSFSPD